MLTRRKCRGGEKRRHKVRKMLQENYLCVYCGLELDILNATVDHLWPRRLGYSASKTTVLACEPCNSSKADSLPVGKWTPKYR